MTAPYPVCPLDSWIAGLCGLPNTIEDLADNVLVWQLEALRRTLSRAAMRSHFYRDKFASLPSAVRDGLARGDWPRERTDLADLPFTLPADLGGEGWRRLLCVSQDDVARMVTLHTSGTTGALRGGAGDVKRLAFSEADLAHTVDFFAIGMGVLARPGDTVLVLLPGADRSGGVADLLIRALARLGRGCLASPFHEPDYQPVCRGIPGDPSADPDPFVAELIAFQPACVVAAPSQLRRLTTSPAVNRLAAGHANGYAGVRAVLSSVEPLPSPLRARVSEVWQCEVFDHYGLTESGYGGGVECAAHDGFHGREADLWLEIVNPNSGCPVPEGESGEVVITTLDREAMPLIRYRTGDVAAMRPGPCRCGSPLHRLGPILGRLIPDEHGALRLATPEKGKAHE